MLALAAAAEKKSEHHLADNIIDAARDRSTAAMDGGVAVARSDDASAEHRSFPDPADIDVVAGEVGIDECPAELLPPDKQTVIKEYQADGHVVAMVGDVINDAPSLATDDVDLVGVPRGRLHLVHTTRKELTNSWTSSSRIRISTLRQ